MSSANGGVMTLIDLLQGWAMQKPEQGVYIFRLENGEEQPISYAELDKRARALAAWLQSRGAAGERALLLYQPGLSSISAFLGCLYAGVVPVPVDLPRSNGNLDRIEAIVRDATAKFALTTETIYDGIEWQLSESAWLREMDWLVAEGDLGDEWAERWQKPDLGDEDLSFLQYTSGASTPKRVMLSHDNLLRNLELIEESFVGKETSAHAAFEGDASEFVLSRGQQALWFLQKLNADSPMYHLSRAVRVKGHLDTGVLRQAFAMLLQRHPLLRAVISLKEPVQCVLEQVELPLEMEQADEVSEAGVWTDAWEQVELPFAVVQAEAWSEAQLQADVQEVATRPFGENLLVRMQVWTRAEGESVLLLSMHHLVVDFRSIGVMLRDLWTSYEALLAGRTVELAAPAATYAEYVFEEEQLLASEKGERLLAYWQQQLAGAEMTLQLPTDHSRPAVQTYHGAVSNFEISEEMTTGLKALANEQGVTLYVLLMAAYQTLLHRYSGQDDILVGSPMPGRSAGKYAEVVGYFVNPVPVRGLFAEGLTFAELVQQMGKTVQGALDQQVPVALLVERLHVKRDPSVSPLFQVMFTLQKSHQAETLGLTGLALGVEGVQMRAAGLEMELFPLEQTTAQMDLWLTMGEVDGRLIGSFAYKTDLFEAETIMRMTRHFERLLQAVVEDATQAVAKLPILTETERDRMLMQWNATDTAYEAGACIHDLFQRQAEKTPEQVAVVFEDRSLTYRELNERANRVAHALRRRGVGADVLVGLCMKRSLEMMVGLLGILKAGGAYVPLDPTYPAERLSYILADSEAKVLVTQPQLLDDLPEHQADVVVVDAELSGLVGESVENPRAAVEAENLAYVIYTSGSTGKPKGVLVEHRNAVNFFAGMDQRIGHQEGDALLAVTSICFDISVLELFWTLVSGKKVVLMSEQEASGGLVRATDSEGANFSLTAQALRHRATLLQCTPSLMKIVSMGGLSDLQSLRALLLGGEAMPVALAEQLKQALPTTRLMNMYGPTEATVWATTQEVDLAEGISIGRPFANMRTYVLDPWLQPVPIGVPGELYIGGLGVARGYHKRPELTAERFLLNPFVTGEKERIYKTGDLVAYAPDGKIRYHGRMDYQLKLSGFRIELGEIEESVRKHPAVREAVVIDREDMPGDRYLIAYVVPEEGQTPTSQELRAFLQASLPKYMVPAKFMLLEQVPLTPNGKVDRKALPSPKKNRRQGAGYVAPQNEWEQKISAIWQEVLSVEQVGVQDNFFEIGGHSLKLVQVHERLQAEFDVSMPITELYQHPTIQALAKYIEQGEPEKIKAGV